MFPRQANPHFARVQNEVASVSRAEALEHSSIAKDEVFSQETTDLLLTQFKQTFDEAFSIEETPAKRKKSTINHDRREVSEFRLVSASQARPISLEPKPLQPTNVVEPSREDDAVQAAERRQRARSVAVDSGSLLDFPTQYYSSKKQKLIRAVVSRDSTTIFSDTTTLLAVKLRDTDHSRASEENGTRFACPVLELDVLTDAPPKRKRGRHRRVKRR